MTAYINIVLFNDDATKFLGLLKLKGPSFLLQKWNVPGGKREEGETSPFAVVRETKEETGITITEDQLTIIRALRFDNGDMLDTYAVRLPDEVLESYQQLEDEPLQIFDVQAFIRDVENGTLPAAPDMVDILHKAVFATEPLWQPDSSALGM